MKDLFPGYHKKTESEIKKIWENGIIMFDTNVLLNLYRYSDSTRDTLLELIGKFSKQIYLPHQAALEYNRNRYEVIAEQEKAYNEFLEKITQIQKDLQSTNKPPFLSHSVDKDFNKVFERINTDVKETIKKYADFLKIDPVYNKLSELFSKRITNKYSAEDLQNICKEGETRYKLKTPPGYEDEKTKEGDRKYGDLILWKQIIAKAKELKQDVILITDERKPDWWWKIKDGRNMGPRQELVEEMKIEAGVEFHMYSSERFLSYGQSLLKEKINQQALEEIQAMKNAELEEIKKLKFIEQRKLARELKAQEEISYLIKKIEEIDSRLYRIKDDSAEFMKGSVESDEVKEYLHNLRVHEAELDEEKLRLTARLRELRDYHLHDRERLSLWRLLRQSRSGSEGQGDVGQIT